MDETVQGGAYLGDPDRATEVFSVLNSEDRLDILLTLGDATRATEIAAFPFSEFREAVDVEDSGRFNYHLDQLRGTFLERSDEGYRLAYPGAIVYMLVRSGAVTDRPTVDPARTDVECPECGGTLRAGYEDQLVTVECGDCETGFMHIHVPPGAVEEDSPDHLLDAGIQYTLREVVSLRDGVCPNCGATAGPSVVPEEERRREGDDPAVYYSCDTCGYFIHTGVSLALATHPTVVSFYHDHGIDLLSPRTGREFLAFAESDVTVESTDPWRLGLEATAGEETLRIVVDGDLDVLESERVDLT